MKYKKTQTLDVSGSSTIPCWAVWKDNRFLITLDIQATIGFQVIQNFWFLSDQTVVVIGWNL